MMTAQAVRSYLPRTAEPQITAIKPENACGIRSRGRLRDPNEVVRMMVTGDR